MWKVRLSPICAVGRQALLRLLARADVFMRNIGGAIAKLVPRPSAARIALVVCSISAIARMGLMPRKAYDMLIQAESGLASRTGSAEAPRVSACPFAILPRHECL
jgi:crotonobetainyl-CoA:carnitine CoA-transferase CaiB-like acyl-CoA transferase